MSTVKVIVAGKPDPEPSEEEVAFDSIGACFDSMSKEDQAAIIKSVGSLEKIRANPAFNDCR